MPRKGENIYKRKDGRWEGRYIKSYNDYVISESGKAFVDRSYCNTTSLRSSKKRLLQRSDIFLYCTELPITISPFE